MKVLLVKPHSELLVVRRLQEFQRLEPLELETVAGGIPVGHRVQILDLGLERNPLRSYERHLKEWAPDLIGFTGYSSNAWTIKRLAGSAKENAPTCTTMVGGIHATVVPADYAVDGIDLVVRGEGGTVVGEIIRRMESGRPFHFGRSVLSPRAPEFASRAAAPPPEYPPLDQVPRPRRDLVERHRYYCAWTSSDTGRLDTMFPNVASVRTSLGCPHDCSFCVVHHAMNGKYLQRSPEDVVDEIAEIPEEHIYFVDDETFINRQRMERIAGLLLERGIQKRYFSWARSDTVAKNTDLLRLWKKAGLSTVYVGLESLDKDRLGEYRKNTSVETNRRAIQVLRDLGITLHASFIVHPLYTVEDFRQLEREVKALRPAEVSFTVLSPSPGSDLWMETKSQFICDPYKFYDCTHTVLPTRLPLKQFYQHFARLAMIALRANPLRVNRVKVPRTEILRAIVTGTKYIFALKAIHRDYDDHGRKKTA